MTIPHTLVCSSHTISGTLPGADPPARHSFSDRVRAAAQAGYTGMCLHYRDYQTQRLAGFSDNRMAALLRDHGMRTLSIEFLTDWYLGPAAREAEVTACKAACGLGADTIHAGGDFQQTGISPEQMKTRFAALCKRAQQHSLNIALEVVPFSNVASLEAAMVLIDGIDNAGLVIDCWHMFRQGIALEDLAQLPGERILSIQINDAREAIRDTLEQDTLHRLPCGEGVFDLDGFVAAMESAGASVPLSVEIISPEFAELELDEACTVSIHGAQALLARRQVATG
ncbi:sugar phosphate isomerase/epimerase family protein [Thalassorhabdomicrobium marinisediminis]|uniref:sugar phosphate isomerase/epimerase family protein n=1 Tax=Thalassorhabdomicrobium marinisediminis TaxID=2170577 RepID=UPI002493120C|nr:sugar phosphate isomerase/epimerase family protein [Thalassorhabdomicrobium marinisediminis]